MALRGPAAALAGYMDASLSIPTATSFRTLAVGVLDAQRRQINGDLKAAGRSEKLSFTHLIAWAIVQRRRGLRRRWAPATRWPTASPASSCAASVNLGLAVDVERKDGSRSLLVPVVRDAAARRVRRLPGGLRRSRGSHARRPGEARRAARRLDHA